MALTLWLEEKDLQSHWVDSFEGHFVVNEAGNLIRKQLVYLPTFPLFSHY